MRNIHYNNMLFSMKSIYIYFQIIFEISYILCTIVITKNFQNIYYSIPSVYKLPQISL